MPQSIVTPASLRISHDRPKSVSARPLSTPFTTSGRFLLSRGRKQALAMGSICPRSRAGSHVIEWMHVRTACKLVVCGRTSVIWRRGMLERCRSSSVRRLRRPRNPPRRSPRAATIESAGGIRSRRRSPFAARTRSRKIRPSSCSAMHRPIPRRSISARLLAAASRRIGPP